MKSSKVAAIRWFVFTAAAVLLLAGFAKMISALGKAQILELKDPIFSISTRYLLAAVGVTEISIAWFCLTHTASRWSVARVMSISLLYLLLGSYLALMSQKKVLSPISKCWSRELPTPQASNHGLRRELPVRQHVEESAC